MIAAVKSFQIVSLVLLALVAIAPWASANGDPNLKDSVSSAKETVAATPVDCTTGCHDHIANPELFSSTNPEGGSSPGPTNGKSKKSTK